jgi:hypothetical protein
LVSQVWVISVDFAQIQRWFELGIVLFSIASF